MVSSVLVGSGAFTYDALATWENLPAGVRLIECPGVAVDSRDNVYVLTRNLDHPVMVFDRDGSWQKSFGQGVFSDRTHGIFIGPDDSIFCDDDGTQTVTKFNTDGELRHLGPIQGLGER